SQCPGYGGASWPGRDARASRAHWRATQHLIEAWAGYGCTTVYSYRAEFDVIRGMLADDHLLLRQGTRALLAEAGDIEIVAESGEGEDVVRLAQQLMPDIVLLDIRLHGMSGVDVARAIRHDFPDIRILMLSAYHYEQYVRTLFAIGVHGYMLK